MLQTTVRWAICCGIVTTFSSAALAQDARPSLRSLLARKVPAEAESTTALEVSLRKSFLDEDAALDGDRPNLPGHVALQRILGRLAQLPSDQSELNPTQQAIANVYRADPLRVRLINRSKELLTRDRTKQLGGTRKEQLLPAVQIFRALGEPRDIASWQINARQGIERFADDGVEKQIEAATEVARAVWAVGQRAGDRWPTVAKDIDPFTFVWAFAEHETFRPDIWPVRMRNAVGTSEPDYQRVYGFRHTPLPLRLTGPLDDSNIDNLAFLMLFGMRHDQNSSGTLLPVQIAAVELAGRSRSLYFAPQLKELRDQSTNAELRRAAEIALKACTRPPAKGTPSPEINAALALDTARIDGIFAQWKDAPDALPQVEELRSLIGLDYGNNRAAWLTWWERDQQSRQMCRSGERTILYHGRVVDDRGQPLAGTTMSVSVAGEFTYHKYGGPIAGWVDTDRDGRFLIRCGFSKYDRDRRGVYSAVLNVNRPGYHFLASTGPVKRYFTEYDLTNETLIQIAPEELVVPHSAVEMNIVLRPAAQVEVTVVDADGQPFQPLNLEARWVELHPEEASPVGYCGCCDESYASEAFTPETVERNQARSMTLTRDTPGKVPATVPNRVADNRELAKEPVSFYCSQFRPGVSRRFALVTNPRTNETAAVSNAVSFPTAGRYHVTLKYNAEALPDQRVRAEVMRLP